MPRGRFSTSTAGSTCARCSEQLPDCRAVRLAASQHNGPTEVLAKCFAADGARVQMGRPRRRGSQHRHFPFPRQQTRFGNRRAWPIHDEMIRAVHQKTPRPRAHRRRPGQKYAERPPCATRLIFPPQRMHGSPSRRYTARKKFSPSARRPGPASASSAEASAFSSTERMGMERGESGLRDVIDGPPWMDTRPEQRLGGVDIAQRGDMPLVHGKEFAGLARTPRRGDGPPPGELLR